MPRPNRRQTLGLGLGAGLAAGLTARAAEAQGPAPDPTFTLLLVNDVYQMAEADGWGGFARLNAIVKAERARGVPMLYAHAGDTLSPSLMSGFDKGAHIIELLDLAPPDVFVPGNHEFDFGPATFLERMGEASFPVLAANLRDAQGQILPGLRDRMIVSLGGIQVGIVGIALESTPQKSQSQDLRFGPEMETLADQAEELRREGAEIVVGVAHTARPTDRAIVAAGLVDILLSGHDHDLLVHYDGQRVLAESSHDAHYVTAIDITATVTGEGRTRRVTWRPRFRIHDSSLVRPDPATLAVVQRHEAALSRELDVAIGRTKTALDSRVATVRARESSFGDLVADALRAATGAEIAIMNGGGIRGNRLYPAGAELTRRDVLTELPFGNTTVLVAITGAQVLAALENGLADYGRPSGRMAQVSGLVVTLDPAAQPGHRIASVTVAGEPLDPARSYRVASNSFLYDGGNGYGMLAQGRTLIGATDGKLVSNEVMAYIRRTAPLAIEAGARILVAEGSPIPR
ncbi:bifunctional metallophosphatase/5'-nucleotidase [Methylobacterium soli]|uniref:Bifunctional metallophosphatase/5'-nucleotidase n=1 Tax=Methylobacterium soli TaxID=553447 RepID=A0A6L3SRU6_9HYPH|nr:bifunctional UDP-sugar hydrolase/5'-nucleotidase [Methylobacterium soli]KAB1075862.1 bifunctional metallophosphatase/5'-nucleotidase [Methylobacterium soli]